MSRDVTIKTPILDGGYSNQPVHRRFPNQVEAADNVNLSVRDGLSKRQGTLWMSTPGSFTASGNYRVHVIYRDSTERYLVVYGDSTLRIFHAEDGSEATVNITANAQAYLDNTAATADELRLHSIADYTLLLNTLVNVSDDGESSDYTVEKVYRDYDVMTSYLGTDDLYYATREDTDIVPKGFFLYDVDENGYATWTRDDGNPCSTGWSTPYGKWDNASWNPGGCTVRFQRQEMEVTGATFDGGTTITKTGAFAGYTREAGDKTYITGTGITTDWYDIDANDDDTITVTGLAGAGNSDTTVTTICRDAEINENFYAQHEVTMEDIALRLSAALQSNGGPFVNAMVNWNPTGPNERGRFQIVSPWRGVGAKINNIFAPSSGFEDWSQFGEAGNTPFYFDAGTYLGGGIVDGTGTYGSNGYNTLAIEDRWEPVSPPGQGSAVIDPKTMPIKIVRTTKGTPSTFDVDTIDWTGRLSGDEDTNPTPSLWKDNRPLSDLTFYQQRLVLVGDENIVMSEADNLFNFYVRDFNNIVESDPIDVQISSDGISLIDRVIQFRDNLLITTKANTQFELSFTDVLKQDSVKIQQSTKKELLDIKPVAMDSRIYLPAAGCNGGVIYEYFYDDLIVQSDASDITAHADDYLPKALRTLAASSDLQRIYSIGTDDNHVFCYSSFWQGNEKKQSAHSRFVFDSAYRICDIGIIDQNLYLFVEDTTSNAFHFEKMPLDCVGDNMDAGSTTTTTTRTTTTSTTTTTNTETSGTTASTTTTTLTDGGGGNQGTTTAA